MKEIDVDDVKGHFILDKVILCSPFMVIFTGLTGFYMDDIMGHNLIWRDDVTAVLIGLKNFRKAISFWTRLKKQSAPP